MLQNFAEYRSGKVTPGDTNAHQFTAFVSRLVIFQAPSTNTGTVTILGVKNPFNASPVIDTDGIILSAGDPPLTLWAEDLSCFGYKMSSGSDVIQYLLGR